MAVTTTAFPLGGAETGTRETTRASFRASMAEGARAMLPIVVGVAPFGMVIGVTAAAGPTSDLVGWATSWTIYAGSAQLAAIELLDAGATVPVIVGVTLLINLRVALYSADLAPHWRGTGRGWKVLASYLIVDPSYAVGQEGYARHGATVTGHAYYLGAALALWVGWQIEVAIGHEDAIQP